VMADYRAAARRYARKYGFPEHVFERQIGAESNFDPNARSPAGAAGIAQIMPATAKAWGVDPMNANAALAAAARNMAAYVKKYGSVENALRAYNAGPGAIEASRGYGETNAYVKKIMQGQSGGSGGKGSFALPPAASGAVGTAGSTAPAGPDLASILQRLETSTPQPYKSPFDDLSAQASDAKPALSLGKYESTFQPTKLSETVAKIQAIRGEAEEGMRTGDMSGLASSSASADTPAAVAQMLQEADHIDSARTPYSWGGGHQAKQVAPGSKVNPLDCSGAVARVLGVDPRVSGQFANWGEGGEGKHVTIYANDSHVLMKINGHFFGTSKSNPGGGAGWIPASAVSKDYLSRFSVRHPRGM
jgi:hypothetical protein